MQEPDLLLADDPTSSLDLKTSIEILELISRRASESSVPAIVNNLNVELAPLPLDGLDGIVVGHPSICAHWTTFAAIQMPVHPPNRR
jgi:phosphonate transport system ATP-binding protein